MSSLDHVMEQSQHLKLLYVEDDAVVAESTLMILEEFFNHIIVAVDGVEGLKKFKENEIDLIMTDISMPNMNGFDMIEQIRALDNDISITILSAYSEPAYYTKGIALHVDGYLLKPFDMEQFLGILGNVIKGIQFKKEIKKLNDRMTLALNGSKTSILDWDLVTNEFYISPSWKEMLGYRDEELENAVLTWQERVHHNERKDIHRSLNEHLSKKLRFFENTHRLQHKDGSWVWVFGRAEILYGKTGKAIRIVGTHTDITEEKKLQLKAMHKAQMVEQTHDSVISTNLVGVITSWNAGAETMLGYSRDEVVGQHINILYTEKDLAVLSENIEILKKNEKQNSIVQLVKKSKDIIDVELSLSLLKNEKGQAIGMVGYSRDISDRLKAEKALKEQQDILYHQAHYDSLTGLPNRVLFNDRLQQGIERSKRNKRDLALLFIDLDHFKEINDSLGHETGDKVLKSVAQRLSTLIRKEDTLSRLGGDEFTVIIEGLADVQDASILAEKILKTLRDPIVIAENKLYVSSSVGISICPKDGNSCPNLLRYADVAMYKAKEEGRNNYQFYDESMNDKLSQKILMVSKLKEALKNEDLIVYYQPQVNAGNNKLIGMEALVRWKHPTEGLVSPIRFIPLAESTGLIVEIDRFVMRTAMLQMTAWYEKGLNPGVLSLNLSLQHLRKKDLIATLRNMLSETACKPEWIDLEVKEGQIMSNPDEAVKILNEIHKLGITLSVDNFGTGYSSLSYLKSLPIHKLKIDKSFVHELSNNDNDAVITKSVIALAQSLNLNVIAEGVETKEQRAFLVENGCQEIQGYLYGKPMSNDKIEVILGQGFASDLF